MVWQSAFVVSAFAMVFCLCNAVVEEKVVLLGQAEQDQLAMFALLYFTFFSVLFSLRYI